MSDTTPGDNRLAVLAADIRAAHAGVQDAAKVAAEKALEAGRALIEAKNLLKHGQWLPWLKEHCHLSERTAQLYMHIARLGLESATVADLGLKAAGEVLWVFRDEGYDPFFECGEEAKREWLLYVLYGVRWPTVEWILQRPFSTVAEWLGEDGAKFRRTCGLRGPTEAGIAGWIAFKGLNRDKPPFDNPEIGCEVEKAREEAHPNREHGPSKKKRRGPRQTVPDSDRLDPMAAELRRSGWSVSGSAGAGGGS